MSTAEKSKLLHLHLADSGPAEEGEITLADGSKRKVFWKDMLIEGKYPMSPGPGGAVDLPMTVIRDGESSYATRTISMSDVIDAHNGSAFKYVTVPTKHTDELLDNTGYVPSPEGVIKASDAMKIEERDGKAVLRAALAFTEPDVEGKVERGTIPDTSGGFFFNHMNKHQRRRWRCAMKHACLTKVPFMGNLTPFTAAFADDDEIPDDYEVEFYEFADDTVVDDNPASGGKTAEIVWDDNFALGGIRQKVENALSPDPAPDEGMDRPQLPKPSYYVEDVAVQDGKYAAKVNEYYRGDSTTWVIPFTKGDDGEVTMAPATRWIEGRNAMIAASDADFEPMSSDKVLERLRVNLADTLGDDKYEPKAVTLDQRVHVENRESGVEFIAPFFMSGAGDVQVALPAHWDRVKGASTEREKKQPTPTPPPKVTLSDDLSTPEGRVEAARRRRLSVMSGAR